MPKSESEYRHAVRRATERYPQFPSQWLVRSVIRRIQRMDSLCVHRASQRKTHHILVIEGYAVLAVYDKFRKQVITMLPSANVWSYPMVTKRYLQLTAYTKDARWTPK